MVASFMGLFVVFLTAFSVGVGDDAPPDLASSDVFADEDLRAVADAACVGNAGELHSLAERGQNIDLVARSGYTPLHWAVRCQNLVGIRTLLELGADVDRRADVGTRRSAILGAATYPNPEMISLLLEYGANVDDRMEDDGSSVLSIAARTAWRYGDWRAYEIVLHSGVDLSTAFDGAVDTFVRIFVLTGLFCEAHELLTLGYDGERLDSLIFTSAIGAENAESLQCALRLVDTVEQRLSDQEWQEYRYFSEIADVIGGRFSGPRPEALRFVRDGRFCNAMTAVHSSNGAVRLSLLRAAHHFAAAESSDSQCKQSFIEELEFNLSEAEWEDYRAHFNRTYFGHLVPEVTGGRIMRDQNQ